MNMSEAFKALIGICAIILFFAFLFSSIGEYTLIAWVGWMSRLPREQAVMVAAGMITCVILLFAKA